MKSMPDRAEMEKAFRSRDESVRRIVLHWGQDDGRLAARARPARAAPRKRRVLLRRGGALAGLAGGAQVVRAAQAGGELPAWAAGLLERVESDSSIRIKEADLREAGIEPAKARRFMNKFGMTFQAYCRARRLGRAFDEIKRQRFDDVILGQLQRSSGFRDAF